MPEHGGHDTFFDNQRMTNMDWFFPATQGGEESGLNDPGIEFFRQSGSLARETLQNSGDARDNDTRPVTVTFELLELPFGQLPGAARLREVIERCRDYMLAPCKADPQKEEENGRVWFDEARQLLSGSQISILRIRDENTTGLEGGERDEDKAWFRLIKKQGSASMHGAGGGTFGIGQRAPFASSRLRTVFYSTLTRTGQHAFIGKTILSSFRENGRVYRPIGFWGVLAENSQGAHAVRRAEDVPEVFRRTTIGTDLYIIGFDPKDWRVRLTDSVVRNFFAAIHGERLVVRLLGGGDPQEINAATLGPLVEAKLQEGLKNAGTRKGAQKEVREGIGTTRHYLRALAAPEGGSPFEEVHPKLGRLRLYVKLDPDAPARTAYMRKPRILVYERTQRILDGYAAVFLCEDPDGNKLLARMEDPAHSKWDRERLPGGDRLLSDIYTFIRKSLEKLAEKDPEKPQDVPELGRYLPESEGVGAGSHKTGTRLRTNRVVEEETAIAQVVQGRKRATARPKITNRAQTLLLPIEAGGESELDALTPPTGIGSGTGNMAGTGQDDVEAGSTATRETGDSLLSTTQAGADSGDDRSASDGVGPNGIMGGEGHDGIGGPGPFPGAIGRERTGINGRPGSHGGPGQHPGGAARNGQHGVSGSGKVDQGTNGTNPATDTLLPGNTSGDGAGPVGTPRAGANGSSGRRFLSPAQVTFRAWFSPEERMTHLMLRSTRRGRTSLRLVASGEDSEYELQVAAAIDVKTGERFECLGDRILDLAFEAGQRRELKLELRPARPVAISIEVVNGT